MATGTNIRTWYQGSWHDGDVMIMRAADHGSWLGTTVFDGARWFEGVAPDLLATYDRLRARLDGVRPANRGFHGRDPRGDARRDGRTLSTREAGLSKSEPAPSRGEVRF